LFDRIVGPSPETEADRIRENRMRRLRRAFPVDDIDGTGPLAAACDEHDSTMSDDQSPPTVDEIRAKVCAAAFGDPLVSNIYRGLVAEIIVGSALGPEWQLCSGGWRGWDFEHPATGCRLEVKQSAARQTWTGARKATAALFDIRTRTGYFEGADWIADPRRFAHIYVFAHHPIMDASADHRDPRQWRFHVVATDRLPAGKTISLAKVKLLSDAVTWAGLKAAVEALRSALPL
jgi:hypothetical protein